MHHFIYNIYNTFNANHPIMTSCSFGYTSCQFVWLHWLRVRSSLEYYSVYSVSDPNLKFMTVLSFETENVKTKTEQPQQPRYSMLLSFFERVLNVFQKGRKIEQQRIPVLSLKSFCGVCSQTNKTFHKITSLQFTKIIKNYSQLKLQRSFRPLPSHFQNKHYAIQADSSQQLKPIKTLSKLHRPIRRNPKQARFSEERGKVSDFFPFEFIPDLAHRKNRIKYKCTHRL